MNKRHGARPIGWGVDRIALNTVIQGLVSRVAVAFRPRSAHIWIVLATLVCVGEVANAQVSTVVVKKKPTIDSAFRSGGSPFGQTASSNPSTVNNGITYNGGPVLLGTTHVYFVWYGNWTENSAKHILETFADSIGGTPWYNINTTYYEGAKQTEADSVKNAVAFKGAVFDNYSRGTAISDNDVGNIIQDQISAGKLPNDLNHGVYFVLTSKDVTETSGFCTSYCAWHGYQTLADGVTPTFIAAFVGNSEQCPYNCIEDFQTPLSGNLGADGMADSIAHELGESVTDPFSPYSSAWINADGSEIGDLCNFTFGPTFHTGYANDPYPPNMHFEGIPFLIQELWVNRRGGYCALSYPGQD